MTVIGPEDVETILEALSAQLAALEATTHDPSEGFRSMLRATLHHLGVEPDDDLRS